MLICLYALRMYNNNLASQAFTNKVIMHHVSQKLSWIVAYCSLTLCESYQILFESIHRFVSSCMLLSDFMWIVSQIYWIDSNVNRIIFVWCDSSNSLTYFESIQVGNESHQFSLWVCWVDSNLARHVSFFITFSSFLVLSYMVWTDSLINWIDSLSCFCAKI